ncbi:MAG: hypothetical protein IIB06_10320, partial [Bacteroidetes bacterium]|nr:hypothetical protein [Bacteroidota bacterium]
GLNDTNENNFGEGSTTRVKANANGDLILGSLENNISILVDSEDYLDDERTPNNLIIQTGNGFGFNQAGVINDIIAATFTLTTNAVLEVNYSVSWSAYNVLDFKRKRIEDQRARIIQSGIYFSEIDATGNETPVINDVDENPINGGPWCINPDSGNQNSCLEWAGLLALNGQFYNNASATHGEFENFKNTASDYVKLGPGTYIARFAARIEVYDITGTGSTRIYLGTHKDELQIIAYYYN